jgi:hypothetical protein
VRWLRENHRRIHAQMLALGLEQPCHRRGASRDA